MSIATHETTISPNGSSGDRGRLLSGLAFLAGLGAILGAWGSQLIGGLVPCVLCMEQRLAYYIGLPILALVLLLWKRLPRNVLVAGLLLAAAVFVWGTYMAGYHTGVEYGFWPGPATCSGAGGELSFGDLNNLNAVRVVPCDEVQWRDPVLGISLAGFNALISAAIVAALAVSARLASRRGAATH